MGFSMLIQNIIHQKLFGSHGYRDEKWLMSFAEKSMIVQVLNHRRPSLALEVGSHQGGSLSIASHYADKVISIDIDPGVKDSLSSRYANVEFLTGHSHMILPELIDRLNADEMELGYVLIDGDHTANGVREDIAAILKYKPKAPLWILMHDSFNIACRKGIKMIDWESNPYVKWVNFDFVPGFLTSIHGMEDELWGGIALAYLEESPRKTSLHYGELLGRQFEKLAPISVIPMAQRS